MLVALYAGLGTAGAQPPVVSPDAADLEVAIARLGVLGSALYVAAHPDDENTAVLAYLARGARVRTAYLSLTRGDGGQNLIGSEKGDLLGLVRTEELLAARRVDGAEQFFTRAIDFGYTKSPEEALSLWGHEAILADVVRVVRTFRPDVIITRFAGDGSGRHGQHTASALLALEAFDAAADPDRFPHQLDRLSPWQARRLVWDDWRPDPEDADPPLVSLDVGVFSPLLGRSYRDIAAASRSMHKSQGFGTSAGKGSRLAYFQHRAGIPAERELFDGVELSWSRIEGGEAVGTLIARATREFRAAEPAAVVPILLEALGQMQRLAAEFTPADSSLADTSLGAESLVDTSSTDPSPAGSSLANSSLARHWLAVKEGELLELVRAASGLWLEAITTTPTAAPGAEQVLTWTVVNRSPVPFVLRRIEPPFGGPILDLQTTEAAGTIPGHRNAGVPGTDDSAPERQDPDLPLENNRAFVLTAPVSVPDTTPIGQPHWLQLAREGQRFAVASPDLGILPTVATASTRFVFEVSGHEIAYEIPVLYRWTDPVEGESYRPFTVVPPVTVHLQNPIVLFPDLQTRTLTVGLVAGASEIAGEVRLRTPAGWDVEPTAHPITLADAGDELTVEFRLRPLAGAESGDLVAEVETGAGPSRSDRVEINHRHLPHRLAFPPAVARVVPLEIEIGGPRIGYVMGAGDEIPAALRQVGYDVTSMDEADLDVGDLSSYDAIVTGIRAYNTRPRLAAQNRRLLEYVYGGGTLVVQYNTSHRLVLEEFGPAAIRLSHDRVTLESAPVVLVDPDHPLLDRPNRITAADFDGWVQERGLYFADQWDDTYQTILSSHDPGEDGLEGGLLYTPYGEGSFIYTGYAFFRQLPAGVPGAFRLFANLLAGGR